MISLVIKNAIETAVDELFREAGQEKPGSLRIAIEQPSQLEHGDYATNAAMQLAKTLRKPPLAIAESIQTQMEAAGYADGLIRKADAVPPGFLNFFIDWNVWARRMTDILPNESEPTRNKVVIEHTSINPNKSAHIGHLRNSCIGDTLARLLKRVGSEVEVHNYIDDLGNQLADTVVGVLNAPSEQPHGRFGDFCWEIYAKINKAYEADPALQSKRTEVLHALEHGEGNTAWLGLLVAERIVREHVEEMKQFGIDYDVLVWESNIVREGFWSSAFTMLKQTPQFIKEETGKLAGCWVLKQTEGAGVIEGVDTDSDHSQDKVLVRSNGILTYTAKDIAYHLWKFEKLDKDFTYRKFADGLWTTDKSGKQKPFGKANTVINVIDRRQEYPQAMVKQALEALGYTVEANNLRHVSYGVVSLSPETASALGIDTSEGKSSYAMSGRQGIGVKIADFLRQMEETIDQKRSRKTGLSSRSIAAASIRYYLLRFALQTEVVFDLEQAAEISGNTGVYLLYAHARAASVLSKADKLQGIRPAVPDQMPTLEKAEFALLKQIAHWPEVLNTAVHELAPHMICSYAHELAALFNNFYGACPILKAEAEQMKFRVWLTSVCRETLADTLNVLGMPAPNLM